MKKGQEEIVGFVAIIVIITVVGAIILGFIIKSQNVESDKGSRDVMRLLESINAYTTECSSNYNEVEVRKLIKECYDYPSETCPNGKNVCVVLNETLIALLEYGVGEVDNSTYIKGYSFDAVIIRNSSEIYEEKSIAEINEGECLRDFRGYSLPIYSTPLIETRLRVCLKN